MTTSRTIPSTENENENEPIFPCVNISKDDRYTGNFGQLPFAFLTPSGFTAGVY
jgi:hypothetical protein